MVCVVVAFCVFIVLVDCVLVVLGLFELQAFGLRCVCGFVVFAGFDCFAWIGFDYYSVWLY